MTPELLAKLGQRLTPLEHDLKKEWGVIHEAPPRLLYHYTNAEGLHGLLSSNRLWATNISYLNDSSELSHGSGLVADALGRHKKSAASPSVIEFLERSARTFNAFDGFLDLYVASFCESGDLLSQWRGYGSTGNSYAVGIDSRMIGVRTPSAPPVDFVLRKVLYQSEDQVRFIDSLLAAISDLLNKIAQEEGEEIALNSIPRFCQFLRAQVAEYLFCFKHTAFREEAEWRAVTAAVVHDDIARLKFRTSRQGIIPYVELDISASVGPSVGKIPIAEIVCGPTAHPEQAKKALELYLRNRGYAFVKIIVSQVPLRS